MNLNFPIEFKHEAQEQFFYESIRNQCLSGGFGSGKTYIECKKLIFLAATFPNYRVVIARFEESKLKQTTMKTFYEACPPQLYDENFGGNRADSLNTCKFINNSEILFMHLKDTDDGMIRGLLPNSVGIDQSEEVSENMKRMLSARVGRWNGAEVPPELLAQNLFWPISKTTNKPQVPNYFIHACNPDSELHWIWREYHPDSEDFKQKYHKRNKMFFFPTTTATIEEETLQDMLDNDPAWVDRFVLGKWGIPGGNIHRLQDRSVLTLDSPAEKSGHVQISYQFLENILKYGRLSKVLDHGDAAPTCCLWFVAYKKWYFGYREYYKPGALVSEHRTNISGLSLGENYSLNLADPQIFKKTMQKYGGFWTTALEYLDSNIPAPQLFWTPADNNELTTRNRISELLRDHSDVTHPITGAKGAPRLYFINRSESYPNGCYNAISQLKAQKRDKVDTVNGKDIFSDERDDSVVDHAYDCIRYYCASHMMAQSEVKPKPPLGSFYYARKDAIDWKRQMAQVS